MRTATGLLAGVVLTATLAACGGGDPDADGSPTPSPTPSSPTATEPVTLTFGVYGSDGVVKAYSAVAQEYHAVEPNVTVQVKSWPTEEAMIDALSHGEQAPDVFLTPRPDIPALTDLDVIQPVDTFLEARNVDLGDGYSRTAIADFSQDHHLTCMPYAVSPDVLYVNTDLIDFDAMKRQGLPAPQDPTQGKWNVEQFEAALKFATRRQGVAGTYLSPTLRGLAPWLAGAGGHLVDDVTTPTTTTLGDSVDPLKALQPILSDPQLRLSPQQLKQATPVQWFNRDRLAVLPGQRALVPQLRAKAGLHWDVMAMPTNGGSAATTGDYSGMCLSKKAADADAAADFLAYMNSTEAVTDVAQSGYVVPVNQQVALADGFKQPGRAPANAGVFTDAVKGMVTLPQRATLDSIQAATAAPVRRLFAPGAEVDTLAARIDQLSAALLAPATSGSPTSASSPSGSPTP